MTSDHLLGTKLVLADRKLLERGANQPRGRGPDWFGRSALSAAIIGRSVDWLTG
jgi:hypothetical protein